MPELLPPLIILGDRNPPRWGSSFSTLTALPSRRSIDTQPPIELPRSAGGSFFRAAKPRGRSRRSRKVLQEPVSKRELLMVWPCRTESHFTHSGTGSVHGWKILE